MSKLAVPAVLLGLIVAAGSAGAAEIRVVGPLLPPMLTENGTGREADLIGQSLKRCGHAVRFVVQPFTRHWRSYQDEPVFDAVATVPAGLDLPGYRSVAYIQYQNGVSSLRGQGLKAADLAGLAGKSVITFADARKILPGLEAAIPTFASYTEQSNQIIHSRLMFAGRVDAVLGDGMIFAEYNAQLRKQNAVQPLGFDLSQPVAFRAIFAATPYSLMFRNQELRDDFNRCFAALEADGGIAAINRSYVERHRDVLGDQYLGY